MNVLTSQILGGRIRDARKEQGVTQEELAWQAGCSRVNIAMVESGRSWPSVPVLVKISEGLDLSLDWLTNTETG